MHSAHFPDCTSFIEVSHSSLWCLQCFKRSGIVYLSLYLCIQLRKSVCILNFPFYCQAANCQNLVCIKVIPHTPL